MATVCKDSATPVKAEEGLTGLLLPEDAESAIGNYGNLTDFPDDELLSLDSEGRAILTQHSFTYVNCLQAIFQLGYVIGFI